MTTVNIHEAKTHFSSLVERVESGETVIIARRGKPVVKLVAVEETTPVQRKRRLGFMRGQIKVPDDFDRMFEDEIAEMFNGK
jgi:prevent-host-death family protein